MLMNEATEVQGTIPEVGRRYAADPRSPALRDLLVYWQWKRGDREMPGRPDIDPVEIIRALPHVILIDVEQAPERYRVRLVGTHVVKYLGRDLTGKYYDDVYPAEAYEKFLRGVRRTVDDRAPSSANGKVYFAAGREHLTFESLTLPLSRDGEAVDMLLMGLHVGVPPFEID